MRRRSRGAGRLGGLGLAVGLALGLAPVEAAAGEVTVEVGRVPDAAGSVLVALCPRETYLKPGCPYTARAPAAAGTVRLRIEGVPPGLYALQAFQDRNGNGRLDTNLFGIPTEPIGFGNNARLNFGPPEFDAAAVSIPDGPVSLRLDLITE